jgi:hypothetical protein
MARYNSINTTGSIAQGGIITSPYSGLLTTITTGSGNTTLPNPVLYAGSTQTFYNSTVAAVNLVTAAGVFNGPGASGTNTLSLPASSIVTIVSDGSNYIVQSWLGGPIAPTTITASGTITANSTVTFNPSNANVSIQPSGTGTVTINPATVGALDNVVIGATTAKAGTFTTVTSNNSGLRVSGYNAFTVTGSGAMGIIGHNAVADQVLTNRVLQQNNSYYGNFIRMYYSDGIAFHTRLNSGSAGDVLYDLATPANQVSDVAERLRISSNGSVGIGTTNPNNSQLHIYGTHVSGHAMVKIQTATTTDPATLGFFNSSASRTAILYWSPNGTNVGLNLETQTGDPILFNPGGTERIRVLSTGFVGIKTTTPQAELDLKGNLLVRNGIFMSESASTSISGDNTNWHHFGYAGGTNYHVTGSTTGDLTIGAIPGSNIVFGTVASGQPVPLQRLTITPAGGVTVANRLTTTDLTISNGPIYNGNMVQLSIFTAGQYGGNSYIHMKTDQLTNNSNMFRFEAVGYDYGSGLSIGGTWVGYLYSGTNTILSNSVSNWGGQAFCNTMYKSSDGYLVLVGNCASYYNYFTINYVSGATGASFNPKITAWSQQTSNSAYY